MTSPSINIRFASVHDAHAIAAIHVASWQKIYRGHIPDSYLDNVSVGERTQQWQEHLQNQLKVLIIEKDNTMAGFASLRPACDADTDPKICGEISAIYLEPNVWRQGLGKTLCENALLELKNMGFNEAIIWVLRENTQAIKFYENMGFHHTSASKKLQYDKDILLNTVRYRKQLA